MKYIFSWVMAAMAKVMMFVAPLKARLWTGILTQIMINI